MSIPRLLTIPRLAAMLFILIFATFRTLIDANIVPMSAVYSYFNVGEECYTP